MSKVADNINFWMLDTLGSQIQSSAANFSVVSIAIIVTISKYYLLSSKFKSNHTTTD